MSERLRMRGGHSGSIEDDPCCVLGLCCCPWVIPFVWCRVQYEDWKRTKQIQKLVESGKKRRQERNQSRIDRRKAIIAQHSRESRANAKQTSRLLTLPAEIRLQIIRMVYDDITIHIRPVSQWTEPDGPWRYGLCRRQYHKLRSRKNPIQPTLVTTDTEPDYYPLLNFDFDLVQILPVPTYRNTLSGMMDCRCGRIDDSSIGGLHLVCRDL